MSGRIKQQMATTESVYYLLEELLQFVDGDELVSAVASARASVAKRKREFQEQARERRKVPPKRSGSVLDRGEHHPVCEAAASLVASRRPREKNKEPKAPTIDELKKRLLRSEDDSDNESEASAASNRRGHYATIDALVASTEIDIDSLEMDEGLRQDAEDDREAETGKLAMELLWTDITDSTTSARHRGSLVKTVRNDHWQTFVPTLAKAFKKQKQYFTPTTLPPQGCAGMRLFGRVWASSCGVVFERKSLDLPEDVWAWPSGFFAKTEFGVTSKTTADKTLRPDLERALATLEELEGMAARREYEHFGAKQQGGIVPYNEVFAPIKIEAVVAVFARTTQVQHLLMAMGARDAMQRLVDEMLPPEATKRRIALLVLDADAESPPKLVSAAAQAALLRRVSAFDQPHSLLSGSPPLPIHAQRVLYGEGSHAVLCLHGAHAVTDVVLEDALLLDDEGDDIPDFVQVARRAEVALRRAVAPSRNNAYAAEAVVRVFGHVVATRPDFRSRVFSEWTNSTALMLPPNEVTDENCLRAAGALACLAALASGRLAWAADQAVQLLGNWIDKAEASLAFRVSSWRDASRHTEDGTAGPSFAAFAGKKAIQNRSKFRDKLQEGLGRKLTRVDQYSSSDDGEQDDESPVGEHRLAQLTELVASCHAPCLRLELLQFVVGLDARWTRDLMLHSCELARDSLTENLRNGNLTTSNSDLNLMQMAAAIERKAGVVTHE